MTDAAREAAAHERSEPGSDDEQRRDGDATGETAQRRPRVLLVDDDAPICQLVDSALRDAGFDVVTATAPRAALAAAAAGDFDVVVSDVHMPGMSGPELYSALRQLQPWLPVVFISGRRQRRQRSRRRTVDPQAISTFASLRRQLVGR